MADYDSNMIKPVEGLKNIAGLTSVKHREERERKQQLHHENEEKDEKDEKDESARGEDTPTEKRTGNKRDISSDGIGIDYCA
jgi:hypothetical protein